MHSSTESMVSHSGIVSGKIAPSAGATPADWQARLREFSIDDDPGDDGFVLCLAQENGWTRDYSERVAEEYKRFLVLMLSTEQSVTPSDQVDQAWHLHLSMTHSYWDRLCGQIAGRELHHMPTQGGAQEQIKFWAQYDGTLRLYTQIFGQAPPADIWPPAYVRFGEDLSYQRLHLPDYWVFSGATKTRMGKGLLVFLIFFFSLLPFQVHRHYSHVHAVTTRLGSAQTPFWERRISLWQFNASTTRPATVAEWPRKDLVSFTWLTVGALLSVIILLNIWRNIFSRSTPRPRRCASCSDAPELQLTGKSRRSDKKNHHGTWEQSLELRCPACQEITWFNVPLYKGKMNAWYVAKENIQRTVYERTDGGGGGGDGGCGGCGGCGG